MPPRRAAPRAAAAAKPAAKPAAKAKAKPAPAAKKGASRKRKQESESENEDSEEEEENEDDEDNDEENENDNEDDDEENGDDDDENDDDDEEDDDDDNDDDDDDDDDDNDSDEEEEEEEEAPKKRKAAPPAKKAAAKKPAAKAAKATTKKAKGKPAAKKVKTEAGAAVDSTGNSIKPKVMKKIERLEEARQAYKWWTAPKLKDGRNWNSLEHAGIKFAPDYVPHGIPLQYDGADVQLTSAQEEVASFYAAMPDDGPQLGNPKTRKVFQDNFFSDFQKLLGPDQRMIKKFDKCNFDAIRNHLNLQKSLKKAATADEKDVVKGQRDALALKHGFALIDGRIEKMGNYNMEPPGLFRGRGEHPLTGTLKERTFAESVSLNLSEDALVPRCEHPGHAWNSVRHDPMVTWLASWNENVQNQVKYVMLAASSSFKGISDMEKYGKAIRLKGCIHKVRADYTQKIRQKDNLADRQLGVAMWVIDVLALRVGGEKGEDEADTVGCCSLRVEHLKFNPAEGSHEIELEFLGKDSMLYQQNINFAQYKELGVQVYNCLKSFCKRKSPDSDVFETLTPSDLNKHLTSLMPGLSAKVFRTYNASITLEKELPTAEAMDGLTVPDKIIHYNAANRQVAILCNHQKTVSRAAELMFENLNEKLETLKKQRDELIKWKDLAKKKKEDKIPLKDGKEDEIQNKDKERVASATKAKDTAVTDAQKLKAVADLEKAKETLKGNAQKRFLSKHKYKTTPSLSSIENRVNTWADAIRKLEVDIRNRDENKEVALGTSKINYMDPRISVAWCKRCEVPIDKVFAKTLRDKFNWAMAVPGEWKFE